MSASRTTLPPPLAPVEIPEGPATPRLSMRFFDTGHTGGTLTLMNGDGAGRIFSIDRGVVVGADEGCNIVLSDLGVSRRHARFAPDAAGDFHVEDLASTNGTFRAAVRVRSALLENGDRIQLGPNVLLRFALIAAADESMQRVLYDSSVRDPLTHAFNRRYLDAHHVWDHARRSGDRVAALMLDIDHFKDINDRFGHFVGDRILCFVAAELTRHLRAGDVLVRYGGEEFLAIIRERDDGDSMRFGELLRRSIEALPFAIGGTSVRVSMSVGVAVAGGVASLSALIADADAQMYEAKRAGRNRVAGAGTAASQR